MECGRSAMKPFRSIALFAGLTHTTPRFMCSGKPRRRSLPGWQFSPSRSPAPPDPFCGLRRRVRDKTSSCEHSIACPNPTSQIRFCSDGWSTQSFCLDTPTLTFQNFARLQLAQHGYERSGDTDILGAVPTVDLEGNRLNIFGDMLSLGMLIWG